MIAGVEGYLGDTWKWDFALNYAHQSLDNLTKGYVFYAGLRDALGPSFLDTDGVVKCGAPGNVIAGCTPLNIFNIDCYNNTYDRFSEMVKKLSNQIRVADFP